MDEEAFLQAAVEAMTLLDGVRLRTYLPVPDRGASTTDDQIARVCGMLAAATAEQRASFRGSLSDHERTVLGRYGHRAATLAAREHSPDRLRSGLVATAIAIPANEDERDLLVGLALHHHVARHLGVSVVAVFDAAAPFAEPEVGGKFTRFARRQDVTLTAFGWQERPTPHGPSFVPTWLRRGERR
jgi:hypothetical protein